MNKEYYKQMEKIIRKNLEHRGLDGIGLEGELYRAAESLMGGGTILIVTGFVIRDAMQGETDGPVGAVSLAGALEQMGKKAVLVSDRYSRNILESCLEAKGLACPVEVIPSGNEGLLCRNMFERYRPTHIVAIERPGRAADGHCYSMRGEDITDVVPNTDILLEEAEARGAVTVAVGDGGNEAGMGKVRAYIIDSLYNGKRICAAASADYLIPAGVSNWGGHALAAALSIMDGRMLLHDGATEEKLLKRIVAAGAVDGCTKKRTLTVDGLSLEENLSVLNQLRDIVKTALKKP